jgi:hypothetical protein
VAELTSGCAPSYTTLRDSTLTDAAWLFPHWQDTTNAERMNYWLSVLAENAMLISQHAHHAPSLSGH